MAGEGERLTKANLLCKGLFWKEAIDSPCPPIVVASAVGWIRVSVIRRMHGGGAHAFVGIRLRLFQPTKGALGSPGAPARMQREHNVDKFSPLNLPW